MGDLLRTLVVLLSVIVAGLVPYLAHAAEPQTITVDGLEVTVWLPPRPAPSATVYVIIFSHGFHGCPTQSTFLAEELVQHGYAVFAPKHRDAACRDFAAWRPELPFRRPELWTDDSFRDRAQDIERMINGLSHDPRFEAPQFDWGAVGLAGHSLGGYTVMGLAGAWPSWKDNRVKAVLAMSPYAYPFVQRHTLSQLDAPIMYQGGTFDFGITPVIAKRGGAFDQSQPPKYLVEFSHAGHLAWTDLRKTFQDSISAYSIAFFDRYLRGIPFPNSFATNKSVALFREVQE